MKIAAHVLAYNVNRFLKPVLENLEPHVDKIYIAYSELPWGYSDKSSAYVNPTKIEDVRAASNSNKIEIIVGDWATEDAMRNACLAKARAEGFDWFIIQDADEFYTESSWRQIKRFMLENKSEDHLTTTWYNFWKSSQYVVTDLNGGIKGTNAGFAIRCSSDIKFIDRRMSNTQRRKVIDCPCYHYSYVLSDEEMAEKIATWGHAHQLFSKSWYTCKWLNWKESTRWLNPVNPIAYSHAIPFPLEQPDFAEQFALPLKDTYNKTLKFSDLAGDTFYDGMVTIERGKQSLKRLVKSFLV